MNAMFAPRAWSSSVSALRSVRLKRFWTDAMVAISARPPAASTLTSDSPMWRDLALVLQQGELTDLVGQRHLGVDPVQLEQVDPLEPEVAQAQLGLLTQIFGTTHRSPVARAGPGQAGLGGDDQPRRVRVERLLMSSSETKGP